MFFFVLVSKSFFGPPHLKYAKTESTVVRYYYVSLAMAKHIKTAKNGV